jgi:hypothetical protein
MRLGFAVAVLSVLGSRSFLGSKAEAPARRERDQALQAQVQEQAAEVYHLTARVAALEAALRPFAEGLGAVQRFVPGAPDAWTLGQEVVRHTGITYGDLRRALATLEAPRGHPSPRTTVVRIGTTTSSRATTPAARMKLRTPICPSNKTRQRWSAAESVVEISRTVTRATSAAVPQFWTKLIRPVAASARLLKPDKR